MKTLSCLLLVVGACGFSTDATNNNNDASIEPCPFDASTLNVTDASTRADAVHSSDAGSMDAGNVDACPDSGPVDPIDAAVLSIDATAMTPDADVGVGTETATCLIDGDCAPMYACRDFPPGSKSCKRRCTSDATCTSPGGICLLAMTGLDHCSENCDPLDVTPAGCPVGWGCYLGYDAVDVRGFTICADAGGASLGAACSSLQSCTPGLVCADDGTGARCHEICVVGVSGCAACSPYATVGDVTYGVCAL